MHCSVDQTHGFDWTCSSRSGQIATVALKGELMNFRNATTADDPKVVATYNFVHLRVSIYIYIYGPLSRSRYTRPYRGHVFKPCWYTNTMAKRSAHAHSISAHVHPLLAGFCLCLCFALSGSFWSCFADRGANGVGLNLELHQC